VKNLFLDPLTGDLSLRNFNIRFTESQTEWLSQKLENKLKTIFGEWFANQFLGIEYFQKILKKQANLDEVGTLFKTQIKNTQGVSKILQFSIDYERNTRKYIVNFEVLSVENGEEIPVIGSITV
jgi:hypothetical protein